MSTLREVMEDRIKDTLAEYYIHINDDHASGLSYTELIRELTDEAFSVCGIPEKEQEEEW